MGRRLDVIESPDELCIRYQIETKFLLCLARRSVAVIAVILVSVPPGQAHVARPRVTVAGGTANDEKLQVSARRAEDERNAGPIAPEKLASVLAL